VQKGKHRKDDRLRVYSTTAAVICRFPYVAWRYARIWWDISSSWTYLTTVVSTAGSRRQRWSALCDDQIASASSKPTSLCYT